MTTKAEAIAAFKLQDPTLRSGDDERGYEDLNLADYEAEIERWADNQLADEAMAAQIEADATAKAELLEQLGITEEQAKLLLS
jgi:hypothetical protein